MTGSRLAVGDGAMQTTRVKSTFRVRGELPALLMVSYVKRVPRDGTLYTRDVMVVSACQWRRRSEAKDPRWDVLSVGFIVFAVRDTFPD